MITRADIAVLTKRTKKWLCQKDRGANLALITFGLVLTVWSTQMIVTSDRMWYQPETQINKPASLYIEGGK